MGWKVRTDEETFHARYDLAAPKSYDPPQMLTHVAPFLARAEARGCVEERAFRHLFCCVPYASRRDVADAFNPIICEASKNARALDAEAHAIMTDFSFMARNAAFEFLRTTRPDTPEHNALTDALNIVPAGGPDPSAGPAPCP